MRRVPPALSGRLLIDTNLLLLNLLGRFDPRLIGQRRLDKFTVSDFRRLQRLANKAQLCTTPYVLTEVSNLAGNMVEQRRRHLFFRGFASAIAVLDEQHVPARALSSDVLFVRLGLTDASIARCAADDVQVVTEDFALAGALLKRRLKVFNFNHLRDL